MYSDVTSFASTRIRLFYPNNSINTYHSDKYKSTVGFDINSDILIIQKNSIISTDINKIFTNKYKTVHNNWEIIIFSSDFSGIAMKQHVYLELKNKLNFNILFDQCVTELIEKYKTYIFKDKLIFKI